MADADLQDASAYQLAANLTANLSPLFGKTLWNRETVRSDSAFFIASARTRTPLHKDPRAALLLQLLASG